MKSWIVVFAAAACSVAASAQPAKKPIAPPAPVAALSPEQLQLAEKVEVGRVACELGAFVHITRDEKNPGYFFLELGKQKFQMAPVATSTGATRLEEPNGGGVWLQLGNKSMLMHTKLGKRLADACVNQSQAKVAEAMEKNPQPGLLDDPAKKPAAHLPVLAIQPAKAEAAARLAEKPSLPAPAAPAASAPAATEAPPVLIEKKE